MAFWRDTGGWQAGSSASEGPTPAGKRNLQPKPRRQTGLRQKVPSSEWCRRPTHASAPPTSLLLPPPLLPTLPYARQHPIRSRCVGDFSGPLRKDSKIMPGKSRTTMKKRKQMYDTMQKIAMSQCEINRARRFWAERTTKAHTHMTG